ADLLQGDAGDPAHLPGRSGPPRSANARPTPLQLRSRPRALLEVHGCGTFRALVGRSDGSPPAPRPDGPEEALLLPRPRSHADLSALSASAHLSRLQPGSEQASGNARNFGGLVGRLP